MGLKQTPSQTVGPYFALGLTPEQYGYPLTSIAGSALIRADAEGERIRIEGRVLDGAGMSVGDAMIEIWQADARGHYPHSAAGRAANAPFAGFARCGTGTDADNRFVFDTVKPGRVDRKQAPHINVIVFMRGLLVHAYTRLYFADETVANAADPVLARVPAGRRATLIAKRDGDPAAIVYRFDIHMQGEHETIFFDA